MLYLYKVKKLKAIVSLTLIFIMARNTCESPSRCVSRTIQSTLILKTNG